MDGWLYLRSTALAFFPESLDDLGHFFATGAGINFASAQTHADFFVGAGHKESLEEQVAHVHAYKDAAVAAAVLLGGIVQMQEPDRHVEQDSEFAGYGVSFPDVALV